ncbi:hypothetical protein ABPG73_001157 [Tetrahymena malaccensis]
MNIKSSTFIFLLIFFLQSFKVKAHLENSCSHGNNEIISQNYKSINEYFKKNPHKSSKDDKNRNLESQRIQPIRITTDYSLLTQQPGGPAIIQSQTDYLIQLSNTVINFLSKFIKVQPNSKNNVFDPNQTNNGDCIGVLPSQNDQTLGIADSDLHLYFSFSDDSTSSTIADAGYCNLQSTYTYIRPNFGRVEFNIANIQYKPGDLKSYQSHLNTVLHEIIHILGFIFQSFDQWYDKEANDFLGQEGLNKILESQNLRGIDTYILGSPNVQETARKYYNCSTLFGQQLENQGGEGSKNYHWERTIIRNELMTASALSDSVKLSIFTVALLKDTGYWDDVNENLSDSIYWGKDKGCDFFQNACQSTTQKYEEFAIDSTQDCSFGYDGLGNDKVDFYGDGCKSITIYSNRGCDDINNQNPDSDQAQANSDQLNEYSYNSKCFISNLYHPHASFTYVENNLRCHKYQCSPDKTEVTIIFSSIPGAQLVCGIMDQGISKDVVFSSLTLGQVTCPSNIMKLCDNTNCVNFCSQNGMCVRGQCLCNSGFGGNDCSIKCNGFIDLDGSCVRQCSNNTFGNPDNVCKSKCPSGYYEDSNGNICTLCDFSCSKCKGPNKDQCLACQFLTYLDSNTCVQKCPIGKFADELSKSCQNCPTGCSDCKSFTNCSTCSEGYEQSGQTCIRSLCTSPCRTCNSVSTFCLSCLNGLYLSPQNTCVSSCSKGYFKNVKNMTCSPCPTGCISCLDTQNCTQCDTSNGYRQQGRKCANCVSPCATCSLENPNSCFSCENNMPIQNNQCVLACSEGFYLGKNNVCSRCLEGCNSCNDGNSCISCNQNYRLFTYNNVQICINSISCFSPCSSCRDAFQPTTCKKCVSNYYLQDEQCVDQCDQGYFKIQSNFTCAKCLPNCQICSSQNNCETCHDQYELMQSNGKQACTLNLQKNPRKSSKDDENRNLQSQRILPIRITADYSRLSQQPGGPVILKSQTDYLISLSNSVINFLSKFIKVQPNSQNNVFDLSQNEDCLGVFPSQNDQTHGIADSDLHLYFSFFDDSNSSELANAGHCNLQTTFTYVRPNFGRVEFNIAYIKYTPGDFKSYQNHLDTVLHEVIHVLGFSFESIDQWYDKEADSFLGLEGANKILTTVNLRGFDTYILGSPYVQETARKYYNCSTLFGQQLENQKYEEFATDSTQACSFGYDGLGKDIVDYYGDGCKSIGIYSNRVCDDINNQNPNSDEDQANSYKLNEYSYNSKCFISNLYSPHASFTYVENNLRCHKYQCSPDKTEVTIIFSSIPGAQLVCGIMDQGISKDVVFSSLTLGQITCPSDIIKLCDNTNCVNFCSQNGMCVRGQCLCNSGFGGDDCSIKCNGFIDLDRSCVPQCSNNTFGNPDNVCKHKCPSGYYEESNGNICKLCDFSCSKCKGPNKDQCLACQFLTYLDSNTCVQKCPIGKFADDLSKSCLNCPTGCSDCKSHTHCDTCSEGYEQSGQTCIDTSCTNPCRTCNFISTFCLSCLNGFYLSPQNTCVSSCPKGYFKNVKSMTCSPCSRGCITCLDDKNCSQCDTSNGYRQQERECTTCISPCATCSLENPNSCFSCENSMPIQNSQCVQACSEGFYLDKNNVCAPCLEGCNSCDDANSCISCNKNYRLFSNKNVQICINSISCFSPCSTCSDNFQPTKCKTCINNYYLQDKQCVAQCDLGYFKIQSNFTCAKCLPNCQMCSSQNSCETCYDNYVN